VAVDSRGNGHDNHITAAYSTSFALTTKAPKSADLCQGECSPDPE